VYVLLVLIERSMHPEWLSNAYLLADEPGGTAVFVDSGAPLEPLHEVVERERLTVTHLLTTHSHHDHIAGDDELLDRYDLEIVKGPVETGGLRIEALPTPGHADDHLAFVVNDTVAFTADVLFKDAVGGGPDAAPIRASVMDVLMTLPPEVRVLPGHTDETTIGREWEQNPFVRYWRGEAPPIDEAVHVGSDAATLLVWSPDYDGKGKALVRFGDGREAIVGGSRVER
jgi:hydroxyacylglutathione hydrolase